MENHTEKNLVPLVYCNNDINKFKIQNQYIKRNGGGGGIFL